MNSRHANITVRCPRPLLQAAALGLLLWFCLASAAPAQGFRGLAGAPLFSSKAPDRLTTKAQTDLIVQQDINFGTLLVNAAGTATISPSGAVTTTGGVIAAGGFPQAAVLELNSHPHEPYALLLPNSVTLTNSTGATMVLRNFTFNPPATGMMGNGKLDMSVGATLQVTSNQAGGAYQENIDVIVTYN